jgi:hypothetical protein
MRIISKFKESYDYMLGYGIDNKIVYNRETGSAFIDSTRCFDKEQVRSYSLMANRVIKSDFGYRLVILVIGTKCFPMIIDSKEKQIFYTYKDFEEYIGKKTSKKIPKGFIFSMKELKAFENEKINQETEQPVSVIHPSFFEDRWYATTNPYLDDYSAYALMNGFDIFQEISSFLSNKNAEKEKESMVSISDKDQRDAKGFHDYSFKTRPR